MTLGSDFLKYALPREKKRLIGHDFGLTFAVLHDIARTADEVLAG